MLAIEIIRSEIGHCSYLEVVARLWATSRADAAATAFGRLTFLMSVRLAGVAVELKGPRTGGA
jgi:hypothetical protein